LIGLLSSITPQHHSVITVALCCDYCLDFFLIFFITIVKRS